MARIRTIKPDFWTDEKIGTSLKRDERLLFIGLWNLADDQGVLKSSAAYIKGQLFSYDEELRTATVTSWLTSLQQALMIVPFILNGESYYIIRTFKDHQLINRPSKPKFDQNLIDCILDEHSLITHGVLTEGSQLEWKGNRREGKGMEGEARQKEIDFEFICLEESSQWQEALLKKHKIPSIQEVRDWIKEFFLTLKATDEVKTNLADARSHCSRWIGTQLKPAIVPSKSVVGKTKFEKLQETFNNNDNPYANGNPVI